MPALITVDNVSQAFPLKGGGHYVALKDIDLDIAEGEFVSLIGHSGCGKSTLLNLLAGLNQASQGGILMHGRQITAPGPERMVVFQNYSLLPWMSVRQNVALAVNNVMADRPLAERLEVVDTSLRQVRLSAAADKRPAELSGGMKQRVAIARALAIRPQLLLLDEPFGALDALTRGNLQQLLMQICQESGVTTVMVTHDVDEALLLSDRVVMLTNGPRAQIGQILTVPLPRPRQRLEVIEHPVYYPLRAELMGFLEQQRRLRQRRSVLPAASPVPTRAESPVPVRLGYLPGLDVAPLALAMERGFLESSGVRVLPQPFVCWQQLEEKLVAGELDAAITSATTPLALAMGLSGHGPWPAVTPMTVSRNGNAFALARAFHQDGVRSASDLAAWLDREGRPLRIAVPQARGVAALLLRHWLAAAGIDPDRQLELSSCSPMEMLRALRAGEIDGFIAGRYRIALAVQDGLATVLATDLDIWPGHPEKVLTLREDWAEAQPEVVVGLCAGLMQAAEICDDGGQREMLMGLMSRPQWLGPGSLLALQRQFDTGTGDEPRQLLRFNQFHADRAHVPNPAEGTWILSQFSRWGWAEFPSNRQELLSRTYRTDWCDAALELAGFPPLRPERRAFALADGISFDQDDPLGYLARLPFSSTPTPSLVPLP
jgi:nitrate/nitrite transport system ATP-binding protein